MRDSEATGEQATDLRLASSRQPDEDDGQGDASCALPHNLQVRRKVTAHLGHRAPARVIKKGVGQNQGDLGLGDDGTGHNLAGVGALVQAYGFLTGRQIDAAQSARDGRDRLEAGACHDGCAVGRASLNAACVVGGASQVPIRPAHDLVVCGGTEQGGLCEAVTNSTPLTDWIDMSAVARRASKRSRAVTCVPSPTGTP